jgi:hypothetical protein
MEARWLQHHDIRLFCCQWYRSTTHGQLHHAKGGVFGNLLGNFKADCQKAESGTPKTEELNIIILFRGFAKGYVIKCEYQLESQSNVGKRVLCNNVLHYKNLT